LQWGPAAENIPGPEKFSNQTPLKKKLSMVWLIGSRGMKMLRIFSSLI
jgi:hypothetical protein